MIKAVIFDCFGVLVGQGFAYTYSLAGGDPSRDREFVKGILGQANLGLITEDSFDEAVSSRLGISIAQWRQAISRSELPDEQLLDYIKGLRQNYKTAVMSNTNTGVLSIKIGEAKLIECFDEVIASADVGVVKPDPRIYELTAKKLGVNLNECVFVDDRQVFVEAGESLGMKGILYQGFNDFKSKLEKLLADDSKS
jgi:putative hydrolase of the HAD superfamily